MCYCRLALLLCVLQVAPSVDVPDKSINYDKGLSDQSRNADATKSNRRIVQSLFRFPAYELGPEFNDLLRVWYDEWFHIMPHEILHDANKTSYANRTSSGSSSFSTAPLPPKIKPDQSGASHAAHAVSSRSTTVFRRQCYSPPHTSVKLLNLYTSLEQRKKAIEFQYLKDSEEEMRLLQMTVRRLYPAFLIGNEGNGKDRALQNRKQKSKMTASSSSFHSDNPPSIIPFQTKDAQQWTWRPTGHFSSRGTPSNHLFRLNFFRRIRHYLGSLLGQLEMGRQSGMFWYPPGSVREWHRNHLDVVGHVHSASVNSAGANLGSGEAEKRVFSSQVWRMYFVRTVRDEQFEERVDRTKKRTTSHEQIKSHNSCDDDAEIRPSETTNDRSAMHIIPGNDTGITLDVLRKAGARMLTREEKMRRYHDVFADSYSFPEHESNNNENEDSNESVVHHDENDNDKKMRFDRDEVWRIPDKDGYVTLFRIPDIWHCVVSEEVHRYSLGFAFSESEVMSILRVAGIDFNLEDFDTIESG